MSRIRFGALAAAAAIVVAACGGSTATQAPADTQAPPAATEAPGTQAPATEPPAGGPKPGGKIVVAIPGDIAQTDPALIDDSNSSYVMQQVVEGLVQLAPGSAGEIAPGLAESWTESDDKLSYTFKLRQGVKFHDGTDFNADAVVFNYERWKNFPEELQPYTYYAGAVFEGYGDASIIESVTALDPATVEIKLKHPSSNFLAAQTLTVFGISSPTALKAGGADNTVLDLSKIAYAQGGTPAMVGTGPFMFKEWVSKDHVTVVKNPDYWNKDGVAYLDEIIFRPVAEEQQILNGLSTGEIDLAQKVAPIDLQLIKDNSDLQVLSRGTESCNIAQISMNHKYGPIKNQKIREAIGYAVDKQALVDAFYAGDAAIADNWMPPATAYWKPLGLPTYDPEKAKALIAESGETDLTIDFWYPSEVTRPYMPDPKGIFEAITANLEAVGFTIQPHTALWGDYLDAEYAGDYEMWVLGWTCDWAGPDNFLLTAFFNYVDGEPSTEFSYKNDELNETMLAALQASDDATEQALWDKAQDLIRADLPTVPLVHSTPPAAAQAYVQGFVGSGALNEYLNTLWLDK